MKVISRKNRKQKHKNLPTWAAGIRNLKIPKRKGPFKKTFSLFKIIQN